MFWLTYNALFAVGFVLMLPRFFFRMWRRGGYRKGFMQRLGWYGRDTRARIEARRRIWFHAVSVGEVYVAGRYMEELRRRRPGTSFVLTTTTSTGHAVATRVLTGNDVRLYFPVDFPIVIARVLRILKPLGLMLTECELWPNLIRMARRDGIPVVLINGRISDRSFRGYRLARGFFRRTVNLLNVLCVQSREDAERLVALGAEAERVRIMGSAKYDVARSDPAAEQKAAGILESLGVESAAPLVVGGSTWPGEEGILVDIIRKIREEIVEAVLVLVPRHAERSAAVADEIRRKGVALVRRSALGKPGFRPQGRPAVVLVDSTGELQGFYARATVIFVGKSLTQHGGQNIIEPALYGKPVVVGPNMENFAAVMRDFLESKAIIQVRDAAELESAIRDLLREPASGAAMGDRARRTVESRRGSVASTVDLIGSLLDGAGGRKG
jgi:3-deoxy-D-manno-octulosonic-acid transferase